MNEDEINIRKRMEVFANSKQTLNAPIQVQIPQTRVYYAYNLIRREMDNRRPEIRYRYRGTKISELQLNEKIGQSMVGLIFAGFLITGAVIYNNKVRFKLELRPDLDDIELEITTSANADTAQTFGG
nr:MAG TPA: hypothetical protein [Caudoviricetes sp.]